MASQKQIAAKRLKAQKSKPTGLPTPERMQQMFEEVEHQCMLDEQYYTEAPIHSTERYIVTEPVSSEHDGHTFIGVETSIWECHTTQRVVNPDKLREVRERCEREFDETLGKLLASQARRRAKAAKAA